MGYVCCEGGVCPQHYQQEQENKRSRELYMWERRKAGNTRASVVYGILA